MSEITEQNQSMALATSSTEDAVPSGSGNMNLSIGFKLNGRDVYMTWMFAMTTLLNAYGLGDYIDPIKKATANDSAKKAKAMLAITRNIEVSQLNLIKTHVNDPWGAWEALSAEYAGQGNQDMATLLIQLFGMRLKENASLEESKNHFEKMTDINMRLKEVDAERKLPDIVLAVLMCMSLPNDMEQVRYRRLSGPAAELTPKNVRDDVVSLLRRIEATENSQGGAGPSVAMIGQGQGRGTGGNGGRGGGRGFQGKCFKCHKKGHRAAECRSGGSNQGSANVAMTVALTGGAGIRKGLRDWVLDNAVTCGHIATKKEHFKSIEMFDEGSRPSITGVGGAKVKVHGKGTVELEMATGRKVTIEANFAPDACANLFSLRAALAKLGNIAGYTETHRSGTVRVNGAAILTASLRSALLYLDLSQNQYFC